MHSLEQGSGSEGSNQIPVIPAASTSPRLRATRPVPEPAARQNDKNAPLVLSTSSQALPHSFSQPRIPQPISLEAVSSANAQTASLATTTFAEIELMTATADSWMTYAAIHVRTQDNGGGGGGSNIWLGPLLGGVLGGFFGLLTLVGVMWCLWYVLKLSSPKNITHNAAGLGAAICASDARSWSRAKQALP